MRRFVVPGVISLVVIALLAVLAFGVAQSGPSNALAAKVSRGEAPPAPNSGMRLELLGSSQRETLNSLRGKIVMVNVFAGWCVACQDEVSVLKQAQQVLQQHGGELVGVTYQDSTSDAHGYMQKYGLHYPVLLDPGDNFVAPYGVSGVPETFIIGRDGRVLAANTGQMTKQWVNRTLSRVLGTQA
ncbi:MAG TPA: TlpA disulfide reductase family protein [Solirubrobacteraceae bacterium]|jgi:cytochrome c biogenesis protein CcmG/thiol:disulfide interchange protein DsbE|nr:TlpA disulfide reductase family protein [Solirubrobacteraceae bacterium]